MARMIVAMVLTNNRTVQTARSHNSPSNVPSRQCRAEMHPNNAFHSIKFVMAKSIVWMDRMKVDDAREVRTKDDFLSF